MSETAATSSATNGATGAVAGATNRLTDGEVRRQDQGRAAAERALGKRGPGRPRKDPNAPRATTIADAKKTVKAERAAEAKPVQATVADDWRPPTDAEVALIRRFFVAANKPLENLQKNLERLDLVEPGELPMSPDEIEMGAECTAGTLCALSPRWLRYVPVVGLVIFSGSFLVSRGLTLARVRDDMAELEARAQAARDAEKAKRDALKVHQGGAAAPGASP